MEYNSIAMIETNGLVSSIAALNAMLKLGNIKFLKKEATSSGQVTIFISGNAPHLEKVINAGIIVAENVGTVIATSIIENPTAEILDIILENKKVSTRAKRSKKKDSGAEKIDTLFDNVVETETSEESSDENPIDAVLDKVDSSAIIEEHRVSEEKVAEEEIQSQVEVTPQSDEMDVAASNLDEKSELELEVAQEDVVIDGMEDSLLFDEVEKTEKSNDDFQDETEAKEVLEEQAVDESIAPIVEEESTPEQETTENELLPPMSHIERLRAEAKSELDRNDNVSEKIESADSDNEYSKMNVPQLRKLARSNPNFPIQGREISKANRKLLLSYFKQIRD